MQRFGVSATTVARALASLSREGLIESRPGSGSFRSVVPQPRRVVDTAWQQAALGVSPAVGPNPTPMRSFESGGLSTTLMSYGSDVIDLNGGYLHPDLQPLPLLSSALARVGRRTTTWERPETAGLPELRDWFAGDIGAGLTRHDVLITAGGQPALSLVMRALGKPGDPVIVETPTYPGTLAAARSAGLRLIPVPLDREGVQPDHLQRALRQTGARIIVVQPAHQNPTGATISAERRTQLLQMAANHAAFLVEDDFARHLTHADAPPPADPLIAADSHGTVVHIRSVTKSTSPNLRVAGLAGRGPVMSRLRAAHMVETMFVPAVLQHTALELLTNPTWPRTLRSLAERLAQRRETAADAVRHHLGTETIIGMPRGGYHLWLQLPDRDDDHKVVARALTYGVAVTPGGNYGTDGSSATQLRISYVAAPSAADVAAGIQRLAESLPV